MHTLVISNVCRLSTSCMLVSCAIETRTECHWEVATHYLSFLPLVLLSHLDTSFFVALASTQCLPIEPLVQNA
jgi:hypothetical protein